MWWVLGGSQDWSQNATQCSATSMEINWEPLHHYRADSPINSKAKWNAICRSLRLVHVHHHGICISLPIGFPGHDNYTDCLCVDLETSHHPPDGPLFAVKVLKFAGFWLLHMAMHNSPYWETSRRLSIPPPDKVHGECSFLAGIKCGWDDDIRSTFGILLQVCVNKDLAASSHSTAS